MTFFPTHCLFQNQDMRMMIKCAKKNGRLYYLKELKTLKVSKWNQPLTLLSDNCLTNKGMIWLHYFRVGHPSFQTLETMSLSLFKGLNSKM